MALFGEAMELWGGGSLSGITPPAAEFEGLESLPALWLLFLLCACDSRCELLVSYSCHMPAAHCSAMIESHPSGNIRPNKPFLLQAALIEK